MSDEVTDNFTTIEEDASTTVDPEKHLLIELRDFLGGTNTGLNSYVNFGKWTPSTSAGVVSGDKWVSSPSTDSNGNPNHTKDTTTGDDLLAAFLLNSYVDDTRDRYDDNVSSDNRAKPSVDYTKFSQPPRVSEVRSVSSLGDGTDMFPASTADTTGHYYYSQTARQKITESIPKYVGWRDHTEGHRITTTRGDKIEIVGGNYKLISLGRGTGTVHTEWSGGHVLDTLEAPGNVTSINWREVPTVSGEPGWQWVEETVKGNVIERYHGTVRTEHYGDEVIEIIGRTAPSDTISTVTDTSESADQTGTFDDVAETAEEDNRWDARDGAVPTSRPLPKVVTKVYGTSEYDETTATGYLIDIEHATELNDFVGCKPEFDDDGSVSTTTDAWILFQRSDDAFKSPVLESGAWGAKPELVRDYLLTDQYKVSIKADNFFERRDVGYYLGYKCGLASEGVVNMIVATEEWTGIIIETFIGMKHQIFLAGYITLGPVRAEVFLGAEWQANFGLLAELKLACVHGSFLKHFRGKLTDEEQTLAKADAAVKKAEARLTKYERMGFGYEAKLNSKST